MVNSIPVTGLSGQSTLLKCLDLDQKSRITPLNIIHAVQDLVDTLKDLSGCIQQSMRYPSNFRRYLKWLGTFRDSSNVSKNSSDPAATEITRTHIQKLQADIQSGSVNGDGILPIVAAQSEKEKNLIQLGIQIHGVTKDSNGHQGILFANLPKLPRQIQAWQTWKENIPSSLWTKGMFDIVQIIHPWIDQHFVSRQQPTTVFTEPHLCASDSPSPPPNHWVHPNARGIWQQFWEQICTTSVKRSRGNGGNNVAQSIEWHSWYRQKPKRILVL